MPCGYYKRIKDTIVDRLSRRFPLKIRMAEDRDFPAVTGIYNEVLRTSTAIFRDEVASFDERVLWWQSQQQRGSPLLIAEEDGQVLGFASYSGFRPWPDVTSRLKVRSTSGLTHAAMEPERSSPRN